MSTLKSIKKGLVFSTQIVPDYYSGSVQQQNNGMWFFGQNGFDVYFNYNGHTSSLKAYQKCAPLTAIINKKAQAFINGRITLTNATGKGKGKEAMNDQANKLRKLLKQPNPLQGWKQFEAQAYIYQQLFGYTILLPVKPVGYGNIDATSLWNIPPFMVKIEETKKLFYQSDVNGIIKHIILRYKDTETVLQAKDIYILKDFTPNFESLIIPESRICSLEMQINNIIGAYESRNTLINYRGAQGFLSQEKDPLGNLPFEQKDKEQLQADFARYGLKRNQWQVIISSAMLKWQQMGYPTKDLMLFEEIDDDVQRICDAYNYPYRLLSSDKSNSLGGSDVAQFKKLLYQDATIPEAESFYEQLDQFFDLDSYNLLIGKDFKHVPALQEDQLNQSQARFRRNQGALIEFQNNLITVNEWRGLNNDEPITEAWGDMYYHQLIDAGITIGQGTAGSSTPDTANSNSSNGNNSGN